MSYAAENGTYTVKIDDGQVSFSSSDLQTKTNGQSIYARTNGAANQTLAINQPIAAGVPLEYASTITLNLGASAERATYACVFGVPTKIGDRPNTATSYSKVGFGGTAYVMGENGSVRAYGIVGSSGGVSYDPAGDEMAFTIHLLGVPQGTSGNASSTIDLGTFTARARIDATRGSYYSQIDGSDRVSLFSSIGGWLFGPTEAAAAFEILAADPDTGQRMAVVGTVVAVR